MNTDDPNYPDYQSMMEIAVRNRVTCATDLLKLWVDDYKEVFNRPPKDELYNSASTWAINMAARQASIKYGEG